MTDLYEDEETHRSWGVCRISKITGGSRRLFDSSLENNTSFKMSFHQASKAYNLGRDWIHAANGTMFEVYFSPAQFTTLLSQMNQYEGTPCTIRIREKEGSGVEMLDFKPESSHILSKIRESFGERLSRQQDERKNLKDKRDATRKGAFESFYQDQVDSMLFSIERDLGGNSEFYLKQFNEAADAMVTEAKMEVDSFVSMVVQKTGIDALKSGFKLLEKKDGDKHNEGS